MGASTMFQWGRVTVEGVSSVSADGWSLSPLFYFTGGLLTFLKQEGSNPIVWNRHAFQKLLTVINSICFSAVFLLVTRSSGDVWVDRAGVHAGIWDAWLQDSSYPRPPSVPRTSALGPGPLSGLSVVLVPRVFTQRPCLSTRRGRALGGDTPRLPPKGVSSFPSSEAFSLGPHNISHGFILKGYRTTFA